MGGPSVDQRRDADGRRVEATGPREIRYRHPQDDGRRPPTARGDARGDAHRPAQGAVRPGGPIDADDRRGRRVGRRHHPHPGVAALRRLRPVARLLFGLLAHPGFLGPPAAKTSAPSAGAPALSGGLASALLRVRGGRDRRPLGDAGPRGRPETRLGAGQTRGLSGRREQGGPGPSTAAQTAPCTC